MEKLHPLIKNRRSGRIFSRERSVEKEKVLSLLEAARWAPSCSNNQPWRFIVSMGKSRDDVKACLSRGNAWARRAPLIITVTSKADLGCQKTGRDYYTLDHGLAIENLLLQGVHLGLVVHPIAGFDEVQLKDVLHIPDDYRVHAIIIVGYQGLKEEMDADILEKEGRPRRRKTFNDIVFWENWNQYLTSSD